MRPGTCIGARSNRIAIRTPITIGSSVRANPLPISLPRCCRAIGGVNPTLEKTDSRRRSTFGAWRTFQGGRCVMTLAINDIAPDFEAQTTQDNIRFHDWIGNSWAVLFSHPKDFTPVCTTELGYMAKIKSEFDRRGVRIIGLSVDPLDRHAGWAADIKETQGFAPNYPIIADVNYNVSKLYGMLPAPVSGDPTKRTPADNQTVRNVF